MNKWLRDMRDNWQSLLLAAVVVAVLGYGDYAYVTQVGNDLHKFENTVCAVVQKSRQSYTAQVTYYQTVAERATIRAKSEKGPLRQVDLDAATNALHTAQQYQDAQKFKFPGCS